MNKPLTTIGRAERVDFPTLGLSAVPARIDSGAKTSSIWASRIRETGSGLEFVLFGPDSRYYTGEVVRTSQFELRVVTSSMGAIEERYTVKLLVVLQGRKVKASFTLANRASQVYPVLVGRNILRGKFIVDVKLGKPLLKRERLKEIEKQARLGLKRKETS